MRAGHRGHAHAGAPAQADDADCDGAVHVQRRAAAGVRAVRRRLLPAGREGNRVSDPRGSAARGRVLACFAEETTTAMGSVAMFCWNSRFRSAVMKTSNRAAARAKSLPFFVLDQPAACTVVTSCPAISGARSLGSDSSSRMRIEKQRRARLLEDDNRHLARHRRELPQEHFERVAFFQVVEEVLDRNAGSREDGSPALSLWIGDDERLVHGTPDIVLHALRVQRGRCS